eukprot:270528-Chlamydomonas_euryale.AAC.4
MLSRFRRELSHWGCPCREYRLEGFGVAIPQCSTLRGQESHEWRDSVAHRGRKNTHARVFSRSTRTDLRALRAHTVARTPWRWTGQARQLLAPAWESLPLSLGAAALPCAPPHLPRPCCVAAGNVLQVDAATSAVASGPRAPRPAMAFVRPTTHTWTRELQLPHGSGKLAPGAAGAPSAADATAAPAGAPSSSALTSGSTVASRHRGGVGGRSSAGFRAVDELLASDLPLDETDQDAVIRQFRSLHARQSSTWTVRRTGPLLVLFWRRRWEIEREA